MNLVLAAVIFAVVLGTLGRPVWPAAVGRVAEGGPAAAAGLKTGDTVVAINGRPITYWEDLERALPSAGGRPLELRVRRDGGRADGDASRRGCAASPIRCSGSRGRRGTSAPAPQVIPQISSVSADSPAKRAGLQAGDVVIAVAGQPVVHAGRTGRRRSAAGRARRSRSTVERDGQAADAHRDPRRRAREGPGRAGARGRSDPGRHRHQGRAVRAATTRSSRPATARSRRGT